jgi:hypothetical protein
MRPVLLAGVAAGLLAAAPAAVADSFAINEYSAPTSASPTPAAPRSGEMQRARGEILRGAPARHGHRFAERHPGRFPFQGRRVARPAQPVARFRYEGVCGECDGAGAADRLADQRPAGLCLRRQLDTIGYVDRRFRLQPDRDRRHAVQSHRQFRRQGRRRIYGPRQRGLDWRNTPVPAPSQPLALIARLL